MKRVRPNPWPTPEQQLGQLQNAVRELASADLLWQTLSAAERKRLGGDLKQAFRCHGRTLGMWIKLHGVSPRRAILDVAQRIELISAAAYERLLDNLGEAGSDLEARVRNVKSSHRLVLVESRREIYFENEWIPIKWHRYDTKWRFMQKLIQYAPTVRAVDRKEINDKSEDVAYLSKLVSELSCFKGFPPKLRDLITFTGKGCCLLKLDAAEISIITEKR